VCGSCRVCWGGAGSGVGTGQTVLLPLSATVFGQV